MKKMKKMIAVGAALSLILSMGMTVSAAGPSSCMRRVMAPGILWRHHDGHGNGGHHGGNGYGCGFWDIDVDGICDRWTANPEEIPMTEGQAGKVVTAGSQGTGAAENQGDGFVEVLIEEDYSQNQAYSEETSYPQYGSGCGYCGGHHRDTYCGSGYSGGHHGSGHHGGHCR